MDDPTNPSEAPEPGLNLVVLTLCDACLDGVGGECHTPGCVLWLSCAPDLAIRDHPMVDSVRRLAVTTGIV
jgi:hypothetical protein